MKVLAKNIKGIEACEASNALVKPQGYTVASKEGIVAIEVCYFGSGYTLVV